LGLSRSAWAVFPERAIDPEGFAAVLVRRNSPGHFLVLDVSLEAIEIEARAR